MARRRSPHAHIAPLPPDSSSSADAEDISPSKASGARDVHVRAELAGQSLFQRCQRRGRRTPSKANHLKWALACVALAALLVLGMPLRSLVTYAGMRAGNSNLRPRRDGPGARKEDGVQGELLEALFELPLPATYDELEGVNEELKDLDPSLILRWAHHCLVYALPNPKAERPLVQVTSFGPTGLVILHLLSELKMLENVPVVTMDTLHLFPESYDFHRTVKSQYESRGLELTITRPSSEGAIENRQDFEDIYGSGLWKTNPQRYADLTKVDPMNEALAKYGARMWITGRRKSTGGERSDMVVLEFESVADSEGDSPFDEGRGLWKLNPLAYWTYDQVWEYIRAHDLPYNTLYDRGYTSLGDEMTTMLPRHSKGKKGAEGEEAIDGFERSGRFVGMGNRTECGLHSHLKRVSEERQRAQEAGEEFSAPTLMCDKCIDLDSENFAERVTVGVDGERRELLIEFYSPYCGSCQEFAPTMNELASRVSAGEARMTVARFDVTESEVPKIKDDEVFHVEGTPTLYRVRYTPSFRAERYEGEHDLDSILQWLAGGRD